MVLTLLIAWLIDRCDRSICKWVGTVQKVWVRAGSCLAGLFQFLAHPLLLLSVHEVLEISSDTSLTQPRGRRLTVFTLRLEIHLKAILPINQRRGLLVGVCYSYHSPILLYCSTVARCLSIHVKVAVSSCVQACVCCTEPRCLLAIEFVTSIVASWIFDVGEVLACIETLREAILWTTVALELLIFGTELVIDLMALLWRQGWASGRSLLLMLVVLRLTSTLLNTSINRFIKRFINFLGDACRVESACLRPIQHRYIGFLWMNLGMLTTTILMIGLYLWAHRSIVFVIESLLQTIEIGVLTPHHG